MRRDPGPERVADEWVLLGGAAVVVIYVQAVVVVMVVGRRGNARALAAFIRDCVVPAKIGLVPDFVPGRRPAR